MRWEHNSACCLSTYFLPRKFIIGLPSDYGPFKTSIRTRSSPISLEELHVLLLCEEQSLESSQSAVADCATSTFLASKVNSSARSGSGQPNRGSCKSTNRGRGRWGRSSKGRGSSSTPNGYQSSSPKPCCRICNKTGHLALDCYHRMDYSYQGRHPPPQLAAMAASFTPDGEQNWFADSGATTHVTNDLQHLSIHSNYEGKDKLAVGNDFYYTGDTCL
ncbi:hypothetical protein AAC387_Pa01g4176 [Persea americana]